MYVIFAAVFDENGKKVTRVPVRPSGRGWPGHRQVLADLEDVFFSNIERVPEHHELLVEAQLRTADGWKRMGQVRQKGLLRQMATISHTMPDGRVARFQVPAHPEESLERRVMGKIHEAMDLWRKDFSGKNADSEPRRYSEVNE